MATDVLKLITEKGALVHPDVEPIMLESSLQKLKDFLSNPQGVSAEEIKNLQQCVNILDGFKKQLVATVYETHIGKDIIAMSAVINLKGRARCERLEDYNVHTKEQFEFDKVLDVLEHKKLLKKVLKQISAECYILDALQKSKIETKQKNVEACKYIEDDIEEHKNVGYVVFVEDKAELWDDHFGENETYLDKNGCYVELMEARLFKDVASAKRFANVKRCVEFSVLKVNVMVSQLEFEKDVSCTDKRDKVLAKSSKETLLKELDKNDVELLRKRLAELEEKYDEKPSASVERKRRM